MRKSHAIVLALTILSFVLAIYFYPQMPERVASHWNFQGEVDGYMPKFLGVFLLPAVSLLLFVLFWFIPKIDPLRANIEKFRKYFDAFIVLIFLFLFYVYLLFALWNLGIELNMTLLLVPALAILFYFVGVLLERSKRNWFIGIRTPWTLSNDTVWEKTHRLGGKLFKIAALFLLLSLFFWSEFVITAVLISALAIAAITMAYSYIEYKRLV